MKITITGAAGFGASGLIRELLAREEEVTAIDIVGKNQTNTLTNDELDKIDWKWKAVHDVTPEDIECDVLVHLAAQADVPMGLTSPQWTVYENVNGSVALLEAIRRAKVIPNKIIYAGSGNELGRPLYVPIDEKHPLTPHNPYAFSKAAAELAFQAYQRCYNLPVTIMSNGVVVGPGMRKEIFIYKWFKNILRDKPIILEGGEQTRDITYVTDVIDAWMRVIYGESEKVKGEKFQISYGEEHSVKEILDWCYEIADKRMITINKPFRPGEKGQRECFSNMKARDILGYDPKVSPKEALKKTWDWMQNLDNL